MILLFAELMKYEIPSVKVKYVVFIHPKTANSIQRKRGEKFTSLFV